jgi:hypothetical protein
MGINVRFTVAVIVVVVVGFTASSFSTEPIPGDWMFDKSKYIQEIDDCLDVYTFGDMTLNSFGSSFVTNLKEQAEVAQSEEEIKEIMNRLYDITKCEP